MTKPIEGWVAQAVHRPDIVSHVFETAEEVVEVYQITEKTSQWRLRPVRLIFTDEQEEVSYLPPEIKSISDFNAMPEADKEAYFSSTFGPYPGDTVSDAIREERERVYKAICRQIDNCDRFHPQMALDIIFLDGEWKERQLEQINRDGAAQVKKELGEIKKAIFGEEK